MDMQFIKVSSYSRTEFLPLLSCLNLLPSDSDSTESIRKAFLKTLMLLPTKPPSQLRFKKKTFIECFLLSELYRNSEAFAFLNMLTLQEGNKVLCIL